MAERLGPRFNDFSKKKRTSNSSVVESKTKRVKSMGTDSDKAPKRKNIADNASMYRWGISKAAKHSTADDDSLKITFKRVPKTPNKGIRTRSAARLEALRSGDKREKDNLGNLKTTANSKRGKKNVTITKSKSSKINVRTRSMDKPTETPVIIARPQPFREPIKDVSLPASSRSSVGSNPIIDR